MILFVKMQGWYDSADGATLRGGWEVPGDYYSWSLDHMMAVNPGLDRIVDRVKRMYQISDDELLEDLKLAFSMDSALMLNDVEGYEYVSSLLRANPAKKKFIKWLRSMIHAGTSKRESLQKRKARRENQRRFLRNNPWVGSDRWLGDHRMGNYRGLYPYIGPVSHRAKGSPLPNPYRSLGYIRITKNSKKKKVAEAGGAEAAAAAAQTAVLAVQEGASPEQAVEEGRAAGEAAAADVGMDVDNLGVGEELSVPQVSRADTGRGRYKDDGTRLPVTATTTIAEGRQNRYNLRSAAKQLALERQRRARGASLAPGKPLPPLPPPPVA